MKIQAGLEDEHVVKIYDTIALPAKEQMFIVMEYCEGGNLLEWIKRNRRHQLLNQIVRKEKSRFNNRLSIGQHEYVEFYRLESVRFN